MNPKKMKTLRFETYGPPAVLSIQDLPLPALEDGEVLVLSPIANRPSANLRSLLSSHVALFRGPSSLQLCGLDFGLLQDGDVGVGILP
jgi:hypothetical protein